MRVRIASSRFSAEIDSLGAELQSLADQRDGGEYLWNGDAAWWSGRAPILFPVIGGLNGGFITYRGNSYSLPNHGFARRTRFSLVSRSEDRAVFRLASDESTREAYPFEFILTVSFKMEPSGIAIQYDVENPGNEQMLFSIGSHPAIRIPFAGGSLEHYYLHFGEEESMERFFFEDGLYVDRSAPVMSNCRQLYFTRKLFDDGVLIFKSPRSSSFYLRNSRNDVTVGVHCDAPPPYLGIWSKPGGAPFVCIEPWHGLPDKLGGGNDFEKKEGILSLDPGTLFSTTYRIEISGGSGIRT
jgi:galactose mutarotase-like enzyme